MPRMKSFAWTASLTLAFVLLLTFVPALLPGRVGYLVSPLLFSFGVFVLKTAWTLGLAYFGARLALAHERDASH